MQQNDEHSPHRDHSSYNNPFAWLLTRWFWFMSGAVTVLWLDPISAYINLITGRG